VLKNHRSSKSTCPKSQAVLQVPHMFLVKFTCLASNSNMSWVKHDKNDMFVAKFILFMETPHGGMFFFGKSSN
jgi:hypothetical protein